MKTFETLLTEAFGNFSVLPPAAAKWLLKGGSAHTTQDEVIPVKITDDASINDLCDRLFNDSEALVIIDYGAGGGFGVLGWQGDADGYLMLILPHQHPSPKEIDSRDKLFATIHRTRHQKMWFVPGTRYRYQMMRDRQDRKDTTLATSSFIDGAHTMVLVDARITEIVETAIKQSAQYAYAKLHAMKTDSREEISGALSMPHVMQALDRQRVKFRMRSYNGKYLQRDVEECLWWLAAYHEILKKGKAG